MKTYLLTLLSILIFTASCKQDQSSRIEMDEQAPTTESGSEIENNQKSAKKEQFIINDSLVSQLESDLNEIILRSQFTIENEPTENRHIEDQVDTIVTRSYKNSIIESYKTRGEEMIYNAKIANADFKFLNSISVGSSKEELENQIGVQLNSDLIKIGNFTRNIVFIFRFEYDEIKEIIYDGYVD